MVKRINEDEFIQAFKDMNREDNFSVDGLKALYEYFEDYEEDTEEDYKLDVIALCVEFTEYESFEDFKEHYLDDDIQSIDDLKEVTTVIEIEDVNKDSWTIEKTGGFIIQDF